jgi:protease-4
MSASRPPYPEEIAYWESQTDSIYQTFLRRVSEGRELSVNDVHEIAQGRIWSGIDAHQRGLVDKLGGVEEAIEIARKMSGLDEKYRVVDYPKQEEPLEKMIKELTQEMKIRLFPERLGIDKTYQDLANKLYYSQGPMMRMPVDITIH